MTPGDRWALKVAIQILLLVIGGLWLAFAQVVRGAVFRWGRLRSHQSHRTLLDAAVG